MYFYSATVPSTGGFYSSEVHGPRTIPDPEFIPEEGNLDPAPQILNPNCKLPEDAVEISDEMHAFLLEQQTAGKVIASDENGYPILIDPPPFSNQQLESMARTHRDYLLSQTDFMITRAFEQGVAVNPEWISYRQALRNISEQENFPLQIVWPEKPE